MYFTKEKSLSFETERGSWKDSVLSLLPETNRIAPKGMQDPGTVFPVQHLLHYIWCLLLTERELYKLNKILHRIMRKIKCTRLN